jgi:hypothetical protein
MKKKIEAELVSIAHRLLKIKNYKETVQLHDEVKKLYDQLTLLKFYEENTELADKSIKKFEQKIEKIVVGSVELDEDDFAETTEDNPLTSKEHITEIEKELFENIPVLDNDLQNDAPDAVEEETEGLVSKDHLQEMGNELFETVASLPNLEMPKAEEKTSEIIGTTVSKQISMDDVLIHEYKETDFVKKEEKEEAIEAEKIVEIEDTEEEHTEIEETIVEETVKKEVFGKALVLSLNDKIAFEKHLFNGNADDLNRVISQLNTFSNFKEAKEFLLDFVKPDYENWKGKEEFETRFVELVETKFS